MSDIDPEVLRLARAVDAFAFDGPDSAENASRRRNALAIVRKSLGIQRKPVRTAPKRGSKERFETKKIDPTDPDDAVMFSVRVPKSFLAALDAWCGAQSPPATRSEAIRTFMAERLLPSEPKPTDPPQATPSRTQQQ